MCGIIGSYRTSGFANEFSLQAIHHRGPDSQGQFRSPNSACWLGHTRLSIVELSPAGHQPMSDHSGRYTVVFNGEIYNHQSVRSSLKFGKWRGHSDTETLVESWAELGEECLNSFRGMFAFAIYDQQDHVLCLVRDRFGIKPLYYRAEANELTFASEVRALNGGSHVTLSEESIATFLSFGRLPSEGFLGSGITSLPVGSILRLDCDGLQTVKKWWDFQGEVHASREVDEISAKSHVLQLVESSVREHLLSDVPVGCFLSGGIDSSIIALTAAKYASEPLRTYTVVFDDVEFDERQYAKDVAKIVGADHHEILLNDKQCLDWVVESVAAMDCPSADAINTYIVSKAVANAGIKVTLSGLGSDEIFGGYASFRTVSKLKWMNLLPNSVRNALLRFGPTRLSEKVSDCPSTDPFSLDIACRRWMDSQTLKKFGLNADPIVPTPKLHGGDLFSKISDAEIHGYMEPMLLRDSDQMSMAVSIELRVPFLDHRLVSYVVGLPSKLKNTRIRKMLLVDAFRDVLPEQVWNRPKMGFALPMSKWMNGPLKSFVEEGLRHSAGILNEKKIRETEKKFIAGKVHWTRLWSIVVLGHYLKRS